MMRWGAIIFTLLCNDAQARVVEVADEEMKGTPTPTRLEGSEGIKKSQSTAAIAGEGIKPRLHDDEEPVSFFVVGGETFTTPASNPPGSNTPGGGVPRIGDTFLKTQPSPELPWWEKCWQAVVEFFS